MSPRGGGPSGPHLLSTLSSPAFDGLFCIQTEPYHEIEAKETKRFTWRGLHPSLHVLSLRIFAKTCRHRKYEHLYICTMFNG